jgi:glycosyltransferase involved in cell wall biosynthesis
LGGAQAHVRDLAIALKEQGEQVTVLAGSRGVLFEALEERVVSWQSLTNLTHPINPYLDLKALHEVKEILREIKPDLVTTHSNKAGLIGRLAAKALKVPVIHTSHGFLFGGRAHSIPGYFYRFAEKIASGAADRVICVAASEYNLALDLKVIKPAKLSLVHNGIPDLNQEYQAEPDNNPPRLISVARFTEPKDQLTLLRALAGLNHLPWTLDLIGDGPRLKDAEKLASHPLLAGRVKFWGTHGAVHELLAESSLFILSSRREGFPISILEAMRAGLPVIASAVGGIGEAVIDGETGYLVPAGDSSTMRKRICALLEDPHLRKKMGARGRERFLQRFTLDQMVEKTLNIYREVAEQ